MRSKLSQPLLILSTVHSRWNPTHILTSFERREARPILLCWALRLEASGTILVTSLVRRGRGSNLRPPAYGANAGDYLDSALCLLQWSLKSYPVREYKSLGKHSSMGQTADLVSLKRFINGYLRCHAIDAP